MDICDKVLTFDDFLSWKSEALREFLEFQAKDKPKRHTPLPVLSSAKEHEQIRKKDYKSLLFVDGNTRPFFST